MVLRTCLSSPLASPCVPWKEDGSSLAFLSLRMLAGPLPQVCSAASVAWQQHVVCHLGCRARFRGGPYVDLVGSQQLLFSSHLLERVETLLLVVASGDSCSVEFLGEQLMCPGRSLLFDRG